MCAGGDLMKKRWPLLLAASTMAVGLGVGAPQLAAADTTVSGSHVAAGWPENCEYGKYANGAEAICRSGAGQYKALVRCAGFDGVIVSREPASWARIGQRSIVYCPPLTWYQSAGIMSRAG